MKEAVVPSSAAGPVNINPPFNDSEKVGAFPNQREPIAESWGPAALEERRERTRDQLTKIAARRESWINRNKYYYEMLRRLFRFLVETEIKDISVRSGNGHIL